MTLRVIVDSLENSAECGLVRRNTKCDGGIAADRLPLIEHPGMGRVVRPKKADCLPEQQFGRARLRPNPVLRIM
jgi:hypothetical protein